MKQNDFKLVRITRRAADALIAFTTAQNTNGIMRVNASHFISEAVIEKIQAHDQRNRRTK